MDLQGVTAGLHYGTQMVGYAKRGTPAQFFEDGGDEHRRERDAVRQRDDRVDGNRSFAQGGSISCAWPR
jgi:hypothetical protein